MSQRGPAAPAAGRSHEEIAISLMRARWAAPDKLDAASATKIRSFGDMGLRGEISINVGDVIDGKFRVLRVIGAGGGGVVVSAVHMHLDQQVAVKAMRSDAARDTTLVSRFLREARAASRLKGEHVARVTDVGMPDNGTPYMVMEYLEGEELGSVLRRRGPLPVGEVATYMLQVCDALAEAHAVGIVHRDLKPSNLFLTHRSDGKPCIKVLDFGISKTTSLAALDDDLTSAEAVLGTPHYMAPEQMRSSREADSRSDIWALGIVMYTLLAGHRPFRGDTMAEIYAATLRDPAPLIRETRPDIPDGLEWVICKCLEKDPAHRYQTVQELAVALLAYLPDTVDTITRAWPHAFAPAPSSAPMMAPPSERSSQGAMPMAVEMPHDPLELLAPPPGATGATWSNTWMGRAIRRTTVTMVVPVVVAAVCLIVAGVALVGALASSAPSEHEVLAPAHSTTDASSEPSSESSDDDSETADTSETDTASSAEPPTASAKPSARPTPRVAAEPPPPPRTRKTNPQPGQQAPRDFGARK
jgi:serine/threonine-protein kinase